MNRLESMLRDAKPSPLAPGPHRERLARQLRGHAACSADVPAWPMRYYAMALVLSLLCLIVALLFRPKIVDVHSFQEQRQILASLVSEAGPTVAIVHQAPAKHPATATPPISVREMLEQMRERRQDLIQAMSETSYPCEDKAK